MRYSPPEGTYDLPFSWIYDASGLTDSQDYLNQFVYLQGGYGDFVLRRVVGLSRVLLDASTLPGMEGGRFRLYDRTTRPLSGAPVFATAAPSGFTPIPLDLGIAPEVLYKETGKIPFDLYSVMKASASTAQIAFQGVRRMKGTMPARSLSVRPKTYYYQQAAVINGIAGAVPDVIVRQKVEDYDFELYEIRLLRLSGQQASSSGEGAATVVWTAKPGQVPFTVTVISTVGPPNTPFSFVTVPGVSITVTSATSGAGELTSTGADLLAAYNADPDAVAMVDLVAAPASGFLADMPAVLIGGTGLAPLADPVAALWIRDVNRVAISSEPMLDLYCDGTPRGVYKNGAIVTPLFYPKDSLIQIDVRSVIDDPANVPTTLVIMLVGRQLIPC